MTVARLCQRAVDVADAGESVQVAAARMRARNVGSLLVLDARKQPIGIVTDRDLALRVVAEGASPLSTRVADAMTTSPVRVDEQTPLEQALGRMQKHGIRRLAVVAEDDVLVGVLTLDDVVAWLAAEFRSVGAVLERSSPRALLGETPTRPRKRPRAKARR
ncbi:MAG: CBS domain-containing protein [Planctomycetes bacterium]|nr:CBS domain-containing protein [Planctomycetota bacterium]